MLEKLISLEHKMLILGNTNPWIFNDWFYETKIWFFAKKLETSFFFLIFFNPIFWKLLFRLWKNNFSLKIKFQSREWSLKILLWNTHLNSNEIFQTKVILMKIKCSIVMSVKQRKDRTGFEPLTFHITGALTKLNQLSYRDSYWARLFTGFI